MRVRPPSGGNGSCRCELWGLHSSPAPWTLAGHFPADRLPKFAGFAVFETRAGHGVTHRGRGSSSRRCRNRDRAPVQQHPLVARGEVESGADLVA